MPIDFSQVKKITIPEGDVKSISVGGVVIWEEASAKVLSSITLSGQTTSLNRGASFSFGGTVTAHYSDSTTADVTSSTTFSGYNMSVAGTYTVTASYTEDGVTKTATYQLTVNKVWTTLWSGSKTIKATYNVSGTSNNFASSANNTGYRPQLRLTFTLTNTTSSGTKYYYKNSNDWSTGAPASPYTITVANTNNLKILGCANQRWDWDITCISKVYLIITRNSTNNNIQFSLQGGVQNGGEGTAQLKLTKIEQYY